MAHKCTLKQVEAPKTFCQRFLAAKLISSSNPLRLSYFKSDLHVRKEQVRHLKINRCVIHPFSKFRGRYEIFLVLLYTSTLIIKPMHAFAALDRTTDMPFYMELSIILDILCWMDIIMTFFTGYVTQVQDVTTIELKLSKIARHYLFRPYFFCDVLSSLPENIFHFEIFTTSNTNHSVLHIFIDILSFLKFVRVISLFIYIYRSAQYLQVKSKTGPFLTCTLLTTAMIIHWATCLQFIVPKLSSYLLPSKDRLKRSWVYQHNLHNKSIGIQYSSSFFKTSAYIMGIWQTLYGIELPEEYTVALFTYFIGKLLVASVWLILALAILNARSIEIKFLELINQLEEYMTRKMLPANLRQRISDYYNFMYQRKYFKEDVITGSLSGNVKKDMILHICKTMIKNVSIFSDLSSGEVSSIVEYLVPEIFLPQDIIIQHGTYGDAMYFLSTGTVAVYTRSGKEICHLQDGAYFGEICLLLPNQIRFTTIVAIETTLLYKLKKRDFEKTILNNKKILDKLVKFAEERLSEATQIEEEYKKFLFEQSLKATRFSISH